MRIQLKTIPHSSQRYDTCGDWQIGDDGEITISVSDMGDEDYALLVGVHELIEAWLCRKRGISQEAVDVFDFEYEKGRFEGDVSEPGDDPRAPYFMEHQFATQIERQIAQELRVNWQHYDETVTAL